MGNDTYFNKAHSPARLTTQPHDNHLFSPRPDLLDQAERFISTLMEPSRRAPSVKNVNMFFPPPPRSIGPHCSIVHVLSAVPPRPQSMILERNDRSKIPEVGVSRARTQSVDCAWKAMR